MSLRGNTKSLAAFSQRLLTLAPRVGIAVAAAVAPALTELALATFSAGENAYGTAWIPREDGGRASLRQSGKLVEGVRYTAIGTKLRVVLGVPYAKYQIGRRPVFPTQGAPLPVAYRALLKRVSAATVAKHMSGVS